MNWSPNPYAIARQLSGETKIDPEFFTNGIKADAFLKRSFQLSARRQTFNQAFAFFQKIALSVKQPMPLERVLALQEVKNAGYSEEQIRRVLPHLVQIADAKFEIPLRPVPASPMPILASLDQSRQLEVGSATYDDPIQGDTADCYLISAMIGLAWTNSDPLRNGLNASGFNARGNEPFGWKFKDGPGQEVKVTGLVPMRDGMPLYASSSEPLEHWPALLEKAYVVKVAQLADEPDPANYQSIANGALPQEACQSLAGGDAHSVILRLPTSQNIFSFSPDANLRGKLATASGIMDRPVMAWTEEINDPMGWENTGLVPGHAYAVLGVMQSGDVVEHVVLRNPYGFATDARRDGYKSGTWKPDGRPDVPLNVKGVFALSRDLFYFHFRHVGWVDPPAATASG